MGPRRRAVGVLYVLFIICVYSICVGICVSSVSISHNLSGGVSGISVAAGGSLIIGLVVVGACGRGECS